MAYTYQAPKDYDKQSKKFQKKQAGAFELVNAGSHIVQIKYDGVFSASYTQHVESLSRQGEQQLSASLLAAEARQVFGSGKLVFMELWMPNTVHKEINGAARRETTQPQLQGAVFDVIDAEVFAKGGGGLAYEHRYEQLQEALLKSQGRLFAAEQVLVPGFKDEDALIALATEYASSEMDAIAAGRTEFGAYDGLIVRGRLAPWLAGASKEGEVIKVKPGLSLDLRVVAQHAEMRATKLGGFLTVDYKGVPTDVGSGLTQAMLEAIMVHKATPSMGINYVDKIAEVECLGVTPDGKLREPRLKSIRHDSQREEDK